MEDEATLKIAKYRQILLKKALPNSVSFPTISSTDTYRQISNWDILLRKQTIS